LFGGIGVYDEDFDGSHSVFLSERVVCGMSEIL
jgi:hypothetical protein